MKKWIRDLPHKALKEHQDNRIEEIRDAIVESGASGRHG